MEYGVPHTPSFLLKKILIISLRGYYALNLIELSTVLKLLKNFKRKADGGNCSKKV